MITTVELHSSAASVYNLTLPHRVTTRSFTSAFTGFTAVTRARMYVALRSNQVTLQESVH